jgi:hypothetical protein
LCQKYNAVNSPTTSSKFNSTPVTFRRAASATALHKHCGTATLNW